MLGDSLLIVPKLFSESYDLYDPEKNQGKYYNVSYYLPEEGAPWYEYIEKIVDRDSHKMLGIRDMLIFVRSGSIIPMKIHNKKLSLIRAKRMPI